MVQRTGGKFGTRCILFSVFENISSQTFEFSAVGGAKPSHHRPQNIFQMKKSCQNALLGGTRRSPGCPRCKDHTSTWAPFGGGVLQRSYVCLWLSQRRRPQLVHLFIVQRTGGKFGTRCILFSVFENIFSHTLEFSAVGGAKPSHHRPQNIFTMKKSFKYPLLRGTRRSPGCTGCKEHTPTWAPFVGGELLQRS